MSQSLSPVDLPRHQSWSLRLHFPASLGSTGVTPLLGYYGCSDSHPAALGALRPGTPFCSGRVSLFTSSTLPTLLSPTTSPPQPRHLRWFTLCLCSCPHAREPNLAEVQGIFPSRVMARASLSTRRLASRRGRIGFIVCHVSHVTSLRTGCSPPAALHPVLPRRSSLRFQAGEPSA